MSRTRCLLFALGIGAPGLASGQAFDPFPGGLSARYQFNLDRAFFPSDSFGNAARIVLLADVDRFGAARDSITAAMRASGDGLARALRRSDSLRMRAGRHYAYHNLRRLVDTRVPPAPESQQIANAVGRHVSFVNDVLFRFSDSTLSTWYQRTPALTPWRFWISQMRMNAARVARDPAQFAEANAAAARLTNWQAPAFQDLLRSMEYPAIDTPEGPKDLRRDGPALMNHAQRSVREQWYRANKRPAVMKRDTLAAILTSIVTSRNEVARMRGFADYGEESYGERFLTTGAVRALLERVASGSDVHKRYERMRIERLRAEHGFTDVHTWDLVLPERGTSMPQFTITEATRIILAATTPFGAVYSREMSALLDPANGRLDLVPRPNRVDQQGFSTGQVGYPSVFFQGRYAGYIEDVIVLGHEAGHAVQNMLMDESHVPLANASGPGYFTESFATLSELLITDYLYRTANDTPHKIYYLQRFLDQATQLFKSARESLVEDEYYAMIGAGRPGTADAFESTMQQIGARYSVWHGPASERPMEWVNAIHFFTRPLYRVNYAYATLLALNYFARLTEDPRGFAPKFVALLSNGYDARPNELLARFVGFSVDDRRNVDRAMQVISTRIDLLQRLYSQ